MATFGGSSEIVCLVSPAMGKGPSVWLWYSSDPSTDYAAITGFLSGMGRQPTTDTRVGLCGGGMNIGMRVDDLVCHVETANGPRPYRATWHGIQASTPGFSTASGYSSTGAWDCTLSSASTA